MTEKRFTIDYTDESIIDNVTNRYCPTDDINGVEDIVVLLNTQHETIQELTCDTIRDRIEIEHINTIYKELGFEGVIDYAKDKLSEFGAVREVEEGLWLMATGGWSDHEHWLSCLNDVTCIMNFRGHYRASTRGGGFYYTKEPYADIKVVLE